MASSALACGNVPPRPYLREAQPERTNDSQIIAEVEMDLATPLTTTDQGIRFRVRRMIQGEPAATLVVRSERCSPTTPGRLSGFMVAWEMRREGDVVVVHPLPLGSGLFDVPRLTGPAVE
jgi:hypothetical protein